MIRRCLAVILIAALASFQLTTANAEGTVLLTSRRKIDAKAVAFPRILSGVSSKVRVKINKALNRRDLQLIQSIKECIAMAEGGGYWWSRTISVTASGPRFLSLVAHDDAFCHGAHPFYNTIAEVFDLTTGDPVDFPSLFPQMKITEIQMDPDSGGGRLISSPYIRDRYLEYIKNQPDQDCWQDGSLAGFNFFAWIDGRSDGLVVKPELPFSAAFCAQEVAVGHLSGVH
jgi:hypothetical protein